MYLLDNDYYNLHRYMKKKIMDINLHGYKKKSCPRTWCGPERPTDLIGRDHTGLNEKSDCCASRFYHS